MCGEKIIGSMFWQQNKCFRFAFLKFEANIKPEFFFRPGILSITAVICRMFCQEEKGGMDRKEGGRGRVQNKLTQTARIVESENLTHYTVTKKNNSNLLLHIFIKCKGAFRLFSFFAKCLAVEEKELPKVFSYLIPPPPQRSSQPWAGGGRPVLGNRRRLSSTKWALNAMPTPLSMPLPKSRKEKCIFSFSKVTRLMHLSISQKKIEEENLFSLRVICLEAISLVTNYFP